MKKLLAVLVVLAAPLSTLAATDYYLKIDGVDGESKPARATVEPVRATVTNVAPPSTGTEGKVEMEWKVEEGEKATEDKGHKNEIDILSADDSSENATNFGILLGGSDTSEERKKGLERAAEVILEQAQASGHAIGSISLNFEKIQMRTNQDAKLFGVIPLSVPATVEIDASETVTVKLPWWSFLVMGVEREEIGRTAKETLSNILKTKHDTVKNAIGNIR